MLKEGPRRRTGEESLWRCSGNREQHKWEEKEERREGGGAAAAVAEEEQKASEGQSSPPWEMGIRNSPFSKNRGVTSASVDWEDVTWA